MLTKFVYSVLFGEREAIYYCPKICGSVSHVVRTCDELRNSSPKPKLFFNQKGWDF